MTLKDLIKTEIEKVKVELVDLRMKLEQADANNAAAQVQIAQAITLTANHLDQLEKLYAKHGGEG